MPIVNIPNVGSVSFPDNMSHEDITKAIETDIVKQQNKISLPKPEGFSEAAERSFITSAQKISGALGGMFGFPGTDPETYKKSVERQADVKQGEHWYSPENLGAVTGSVGVQLPAMLAGAPVVAATAPASLGGLGTAALTGLAGSALTAPGEYWGAEQEALMKGATPDQAKNMGRNAAAWTVAGNMLPGQGGLFGRFVKGAAQNVGANIGEAYTHNVLADGNKKLEHDPWDTNNLILSGVLGGSLGMATGSRKGERWLSKNEKPDTPVYPKVGRDLYKEAAFTIDKEIKDKTKEIEFIVSKFEDGSISEQDSIRLQQLDDDITRLKSQQEEIAAVMSGKGREQKADKKAEADAKQNQMRQAKGMGARGVSPFEEVPPIDNIPPYVGRTPDIDPDTGEILSLRPLEEQAEPKVDPYTVAQERILRVSGMPNELLQTKVANRYLTEVNERLAALEEQAPKDGVPGAEHSSLREALLNEKEVYESILRSKQGSKVVRRYGDGVPPLDKTKLDFSKEKLDDPDIQRFIELVDKTSRAEIDDTTYPWTVEQRYLYDMEDFEGFSKSRGYTKEQIDDYRELNELSTKLDERYKNHEDLYDGTPWSQAASFHITDISGVHQEPVSTAPKTDVELPTIDETMLEGIQPKIEGEERLRLIEEARAKSQAQKEEPSTGFDGLPPDKLNLPVEQRDRVDRSSGVARPETKNRDFILSPSTAPFVEKMKSIGGMLTPSQLVAVARAQIKELENMLGRINQQLVDYDEGRLPSGAFDERDALNLRSQLEDSLDHWEAMRELGESGKGSDEAFAKAKPQQDANKPTIYESVQDILNLPEAQQLKAFRDNPQLFNTVPGTKIHFDVNLPKALQITLEYMAKKLGWLTGEKGEQLYFVFNKDDRGNGPAHHNIIGNTGIINFHPGQIAEAVNTHLKNRNLLDKISEGFGKKDNVRQNYLEYVMAGIAAHEMGHHLMLRLVHEHTRTTDRFGKLGETDFVKHLMTRYEAWLENKNKAQHYKNNEYFREHFAEFFSEEVRRNLMYKQLGAKSRFPAGFNHIRKILHAAREYLTTTKKIDPWEGDTFITEIVDKIVASTKEQGKLLFDTHELVQSSKAVDLDKTQGARFFEGKTLEDVMVALQDTQTKGEFIGTNPDNPLLVFASKDKQQGAGPQKDSGNLSLGFGKMLLTKRFANVQIAQIFENNPTIVRAYGEIRKGQRAATQAIKKIWHGEESIASFDGKSIFSKFSNSKNKTTPYWAVEHLKDREAYNILQVAKKAFDEEITHQEAMVKYASELTESELKSYETLAKMWDTQFEEALKLQNNLGKKDRLPYRKGWYPSVRSGNYQVNLSMQGHVFRSQSFLTETGAKHFQEQVKKLGARGIEISDVIDTKAKTQLDEHPLIDMIQDKIKRAYPRAGGAINATIDNVLASSAERGGKLGKHHEKRTNMEGYHGTELFKSPEELGKNFKKAITNSVDEFGNKMQTMYIRTHLRPILEDQSIDPNTRAIVQQMFDNVTSNNKNHFESLDTWTLNTMESMSKSVTEMFGGEYKGEKLHAKNLMNHSMEWLYLAKIMSKLSFVFGQALAPLQSLRHMSIEGGFIKPWVSLGKGLMDLTTGNADLKRAIIESKNDSNTFEPQFVDALELTSGDGPFMKAIKDWGFTRKPSELADTYQRVITFAAMYNNYKDLGYSHEDARVKAMEGTDSTMGSYGTADTAAVFKHTGGIGSLVKPLQTLPTQMLGNFVADIARIARNPVKLKAYAPFINYALTTMIIGGAMGLQGVQEYEAIRKLLEDNNLPALPPVIDIMKQDNDFLNLEGFDEQRALLLGVIPEVLGVDMASSLRANETLEAVVAAIISGHKAWYEATPTISFPAEVAGGAVSLAKYGASLATGGTGLENSALAKAIGNFFPAGPIGYGAKEVMGANETKLLGQNTGMLQGGTSGEATKQREAKDTVAGILGTKSTEDRSNLLVGMRKIELDKRRQNQIRSAANKFAETGDTQHLQRLVDLGVKDKELANTISNQMYKKIVDAKKRYVMNKQGRVNERKAQQSLEYNDF